MARDAKGGSVKAQDPSACALCLSGALGRACSDLNLTRSQADQIFDRIACLSGTTRVPNRKWRSFSRHRCSMLKGWYLSNMARIVEGPKPKRVKCKDCEAVIEYLPEEVLTSYWEDGGREYIKCPREKCPGDGVIKSW